MGHFGNPRVNVCENLLHKQNVLFKTYRSRTYENRCEAELKKIETVRLKFAAADLSSIKKNSFDQKKEHWRKNDQSEEKKNEIANEKREPSKKVQEAPKTYYRALPTVSGLKLDQALLSKLCEMGFDRALATQGRGGPSPGIREPGRPRPWKKFCPPYKSIARSR